MHKILAIDLQIVFRLNRLWSILLLVPCLLLVSHPKAGNILLVLIAGGYVYVAALAVRGERWAIILSVIAAILTFVRWTPMVIVNVVAFVLGHELYRDSPGTIIVVIPLAIMFMLPSIFFCWQYYLHRAEIKKMLRSGETKEVSDSWM